MNRKQKKERSKRIKHQQSIQKNFKQISLLSLPSNGSETIIGHPDKRMPITPKFIHWLEHQSSSIPVRCRSCRYLHGRNYFGQLLVCAIHPDGLENCPDFEPVPISKTVSVSKKRTATGGKSVLIGEIIVMKICRGVDEKILPISRTN